MPTFSYCSGTDPAETSEPADETEEDAFRDSLTVVFPQAAQSLELFCYDGKPTRQLEWHLSYYSDIDYGFRWPDSLGGTIDISILHVPEDGSIVAVANCPGMIREGSVRSMDSMELLQVSYADEAIGYPVMSGISGGGRVELKSLLCEIVLVSVSNGLGGDILLESPVFRLEKVNTGAELFRQVGFRPVQTADTYAGLRCPSLMYSPLPCDIGKAAGYPDIHLFCYPNDSDTPSEGTPRTRAVFECLIDGKTARFEYALPPLTRGCSVRLELSVTEDGKGEWADY